MPTEIKPEILAHLALALDALTATHPCPFDNVRLKYIPNDAGAGTMWWQIVAHDKYLDMDYQLLDPKEHAYLRGNHQLDNVNDLHNYAVKIMARESRKAKELNIKY